MPFKPAAADDRDFLPITRSRQIRSSDPNGLLSGFQPRDGLGLDGPNNAGRPGVRLDTSSTGRSYAVASSAKARGSSSRARRGRAAFVFRHSAKHRSGTEPFTKNLHARMEAACPRIPFLQKFLRLLHPKLRSSSGRIWPGA